jgi:hypothetical protein
LGEEESGPGERQAKPDDAMKRLKKDESGALGDMVASRNRFGEYDRKRVSPKHPGTVPQLGAWGNMKDLSRLWNGLREEQRVAWRRLAPKVRSRRRLGQDGPLDGRQLFLKLNRVLATCGREPLFDPPPLPDFGRNPVKGFTIREGKDGAVLKLRVSKEPAEDIMVFGWAPYNAGAEKNTNYAFLGLLGPAEGGQSDITGMYMKKLKEWRQLKGKRYHVAWEGSRVFIRAWQQVNGWENKVWRFEGSDFVPARKEAGGGKSEDEH